MWSAGRPQLGQTGYVFAPWQTYELTGWRKSDQQVAAFEFTALPDSYAARTGRPLDVGVIGVAIFREKLRPPAVQVLPQARDERRADRMDSNGASPAAAAVPSQAPPASPPASPPAPSATGKASAEMQEAARSRLGTGHGEREDSRVSRTDFERASSTPNEIISLQYDRYENLLAAGIIPADGPQRVARPRPFPGSRDSALYVPDPPRY